LKYGRQRLWGTIGFGVTACLAGYLIDLWSEEEVYKTYTPSMLLVLVFTCIDLICCIKLKVVFYGLQNEKLIKQYIILFLSFYLIVDFCYSCHLNQNRQPY